MNGSEQIYNLEHSGNQVLMESKALLRQQHEIFVIKDNMVVLITEVVHIDRFLMNYW